MISYGNYIVKTGSDNIVDSKGIKIKEIDGDRIDHHIPPGLIRIVPILSIFYVDVVVPSSVNCQ